MVDPSVTRAYLLAEVEALEPFDFVALCPAGKPLEMVEVTRREDAALDVRVPGRPPLLPALASSVLSSLRERGFSSEAPDDPSRPWRRGVADGEEAVDLALGLFVEVFRHRPGVSVDVTHGSHKAEHEAKKKVAAVRERIEKALSEMAGHKPEQDEDGDYILPVDDVHVMVAPRVAPLGGVIVRVFAVTNVGVTVAPDLGLFLARLNFGLMFGRFALDAEHRSIWVDETLLGEHFTDDELRFIVSVVASTADEWDDRLAQMFGGVTYQQVLTKRTEHEKPPTKPGHGGYL